MSVSSLSSASAAAPVAGEPSSEGQPAPTPDDVGKVPLWRSGVVLLLTALVGLIYGSNPPVPPQAKSGVALVLRVMRGYFWGNPGEISGVELNTPPRDPEFPRRYYDDGRGHQINCSIVL